MVELSTYILALTFSMTDNNMFVFVYLNDSYSVLIFIDISCGIQKQ
jgi:hypothetical protein